MLAAFVVFQLLLIAVAFMGGFLFHEWQYSDQSVLSEVPFFKKEFALLSEAHHLLQENAFLPLPDAKKLEYGMVRGMLQAYDEPFTVFVEPPQHELQTNQLQGKFGGIGVRIERDAENYVYLYPLPNSTALEAGVQEADRLLRVEDLEIMPETTNDEVQAAIRGPIGRKVEIAVGRLPDYAPIELRIERAEVALPSVTWNLAPNVPQVGLLQVHVIASTTPDEITKAIADLQQRGASRFVIDVRNNGGGLVEAGVDTARLFLAEGTVIEQQYRGQDVKVFEVEEPGPFANLPVVLLVNRGTASAAEIFAGALQGQNRAPLVGTRTYGKDSIQLVFNLSDGSSLHVTAAQWWVPGLSPEIGENGLQPDVPVDENADANTGLQKAIETILE
jgi:carboxyl-terminal processing protease